MVRIFHYREKCIGCFYCVEIAQDRWTMNENDGKSVLIGSKSNKGIFMIEVQDWEYEQNKQAAESCPVNCIKLEKY